MQGDEVVILTDWPQPDAGVPNPRLVANEPSVLLRYNSTKDRVAIAHFPRVSSVVFGAPNDETLEGHRLWAKGLKHYSVSEVRNSSWIDLLERQNAVHDRHNKTRFLEGKKHYVFTFHDSTLEIIATESSESLPDVRVFEDEAAADGYWHSKVVA